MADSKRTEQRLLDSIRKAKAGDDGVPDATADADADRPSAAAGAPRSPAAPTPKTSARGATTRKTTAKQAPAKTTAARRASSARSAASDPPARGATTAAPYPLPTITRPQPAAYPGASAENDPYRSHGRIWPD